VNTIHAIISFCLLGTVVTRAEIASPSVVIADMTKKYAECLSYQDSGVARILVHGKPSPHPRLFKTYFVRPAHFRFDWTETIDMPEFRNDGSYKPRRLTGVNLVWSTPEGVHEYYDGALYSNGGAIRPVEDLNLAVASATGVSLGAALTVPSLLTSKIHAFRLTELQSLVFLPDVKFEGVTCYHIQGKSMSPPETDELWIGKKDFLLRKLLSTSGASPDDPIEELHRNIRINGNIPFSIFTFTLR